VRLLFGKTKEPLLYTFKLDDYYGILQMLARELHAIYLEAVALTTDRGPKNQRMLRKLRSWNGNTGEVGKCSFKNPVTDRDVLYMAAHLSKLLRNHFIDDGTTLEDGTVIKKFLIEIFLGIQKDEIKLTHNLTHRVCKGSKK